MSHHETRLSLESTLEQLRTCILDAVSGAQVDVDGGGGHFTITVVSDAFEGQSTLARQRMVYGAISELMTGDDAPVHAVDRMITKTSNE